MISKKILVKIKSWPILSLRSAVGLQKVKSHERYLSVLLLP